ncbi:MAG: tRNA (N6-isopentenyl adenosine(37)-C2)-methylthiotransferase MiaB [Thermodesulfobacteriota bacterium]
MKKKLVYLHTMGCQMNVYDSDQMLRRLAAGGYERTENEDLADLIVVNTCAVREKAEHKVISFLGRLVPLKRRKPELVIAVGGCVAQVSHQEILSRMPIVDIVFGPHAAGRVDRLVEQARSGRRPVVDISQDEPCDFSGAGLPAAQAPGPTAFVTIMSGCDNFCTYCVVPFTRGREASRPAADVVAEVAALAAAGVSEVTLLGQNVNSYGKKEGASGFVDLLTRVAQIPGILRIRFVTSHPRDLSPELIAAFSSIEKLCPHLHLPVQSGSDRILKKMNRGYTAEEYLRKVEGLRAARPGMALSTDFIAGFPSETEEDFSATLRLLHTVGFDMVYAFAYSDRPMAAATRFPNKVDGEAKSRRLAEILSAAERIIREKNEAFIGRRVEVLAEGRSRNNPQELTGRAPDNRIVNFAAESPPEELTGRVVPVLVERGLAHSLWGREILPGEET